MALQDSSSDDDYVAQLLAKEAKEASKKYSELGVRALLPTRPTTAAPKPNTRFLKHIIRETDNHNLALKKKEELEAKLRLRKVSNGNSTTLDSHRRGNERRRKRRRVDDNREYDRSRRRKSPCRLPGEDSQGRTSPRVEEDRRRGTGLYSGERSQNGGVESRRTGVHDEEQHKRYGHRENLSSMLRDLTNEEERSRSHRKQKRRQSFSTESNSSDEHDHYCYRRKGRGYRTHQERLSPPSDHSRCHRRDSRQSRPRTPVDVDGENSTNQKNGTSRAVGSDSDSDSDPLEALVGPLPSSSKSTFVNDPPPLRSRGRGAYKPSASAMDKHFSSTYNPSLDLHLDSELEDENEDWDMALEALRDRKLWKQKGAERLRAAGFGDEEIKKWEDSGREKGAEDVKWTGKGEAREWDRGKVVEVGDRKGEAALESAWKRKGGGFLKDFKKALG